MGAGRNAGPFNIGGIEILELKACFGRYVAPSDTTMGNRCQAIVSNDNECNAEDIH